MFSARKLVTLQHGIQIQLAEPRRRETACTVDGKFSINLLLIPEGWTSVLTTCSPVGGLVKLPFAVSRRWLGSQPLWSFLYLLYPPASFTPLRSAERLHCRPHKGRREMSERAHVKSHKRWLLSLANPPPLQGLNGKISSGVWQNGLALFNFKGVCVIIKKII